MPQIKEEVSTQTPVEKRAGNQAVHGGVPGMPT